MQLEPKLLPLHGAFFRSIDFRDLRDVAEEVSLNVVKQKILGVRIAQVQAVMIDNLGLFLQPVTPARLADFGSNSLAQRVGEWGER